MSIKISKEKPLKEEKNNNTDLQGKNWIIEFKTPSTPLFSKNPSRNNISGISKELSSATIQLNLYIKKNNRESDLIDSFTQGALIIGHKKEIDGEKDKIMALKLFKEMSQTRILLFSNITKIVEQLIEMFESKIK